MFKFISKATSKGIYMKEHLKDFLEKLQKKFLKQFLVWSPKTMKEWSWRNRLELLAGCQKNTRRHFSRNPKRNSKNNLTRSSRRTSISEEISGGNLLYQDALPVKMLKYLQKKILGELLEGFLNKWLKFHVRRNPDGISGANFGEISRRFSKRTPEAIGEWIFRCIYEGISEYIWIRITGEISRETRRITEIPEATPGKILEVSERNLSKNTQRTRRV